MSLYEHRSWTRSGDPASVRQRPAAGSRQAVRLLHPQAFDSGVDSRRVRIGLAVMAGLVVVVLNLGIYHSARNELLAQHWDELAPGLRSNDPRREKFSICVRVRVDHGFRFNPSSPNEYSKSRFA